MRPAVFKGNVAVSNLPAEMTPDGLCDLFDQYGLVLGAKIDRWHDRPGGGLGQVDLAPDSAVEAAIAALNGFAIGGVRLSVKRHKPTSDKSGEAKKRAPRAVAAVPRSPAAEPSLPVRPLRPRAPDPLDEMVQPSPAFRPASAAPAFVGSTRQVVVEYRAPRRVILPPRQAKTSG